MRIIVPVLFTTAGSIVLGACGGGEREPMTPAAEVAPRTNAQQAVERIAAARCDREQSCGDIAKDKEFSDREHCLASMRSDASQSLGNGCRYGVSEQKLEQCLQEIATQGCGGISAPFTSLETSMACRAGALCLD